VKRALVHDVAVDIEQGRAILTGNDSVRRPDFVK
jgi:hypothetical protein